MPIIEHEMSGGCARSRLTDCRHSPGANTTRPCAAHALKRRSPTTYTRTRDELITEGDLYAPRRGELALTVPLMRPYLLAHYEELRARANVPILALDEMQRLGEELRSASPARSPRAA